MGLPTKYRLQPVTHTIGNLIDYLAPCHKIPYQSYENGKVISAEETPAYRLQELLHDPAVLGRFNALST